MEEFLLKAVKVGKAVGGVLAYPLVSYPAAFVAGKYLGDPVFGLVGDLIAKAIS